MSVVHAVEYPETPPAADIQCLLTFFSATPAATPVLAQSAWVTQGYVMRLALGSGSPGFGATAPTLSEQPTVEDGLKMLLPKEGEGFAAPSIPPAVLLMLLQWLVEIVKKKIGG